ncbi:MAG: hypothetical protein JXR23_08710 [Pontiellaceae bacterium]|nr:hypothetical protein [Pontiellaceae bacterium]
MKKRYGKRTGKVNKGAPSGFIISLLLHAAAFAVAGVFVVFTVMKPKAPEFVAPPPMERPKMNLKKPIVKVRRSSSPAPASRIVAKVKMAKMPEISIPDLTGTGDALMSGMGGMGGNSFGLPGPGGTYLFGDKVTSGNDLEVTFYSLGRARSGAKRQISEMEYFDIIRRFVEGGFDTSILKNYYRSTGKLYAQCVAIPKVRSIAGPLAFGESDYLANSSRWAAHYKGKIKHKDGVTFRLWGASDDVLNVAINGEVVLAANLPWGDMSAYKICEFFQGGAPGSSTTQRANDGRYWICDTENHLMGSDWITLEPGKEYDFDAVVGEGPGGEFYAVLMAELQDEYYEKNDRGQPIWPLFATAPLSWDAQDSIMLNMIEDDFNVTSITNFFILE